MTCPRCSRSQPDRPTKCLCDVDDLITFLREDRDRLLARVGELEAEVAELETALNDMRPEEGSS